MDITKQFLKIRDFLIEHSWLIELEVLERYQSVIPDKYQAWTEIINALAPEQKQSLENSLEMKSRYSYEVVHISRTVYLYI